MSANATSTDPNRQHLETAREQISRGDLQQAALTLNKAQKALPNDPRVFLLAGLMAEKASNIPKAFEALNRAVALAPDWGPAQLELALLHARQNQLHEAVQLAEKVALREPRNPIVLAGVVDIAHRSGNLEMAVRHLRRGLEMVPGDVQLRRLLARDLSDQGNHAEALQTWGALIDENPQDAEARLGRVKTYIAAGNPARAVADTTALLEIAPGDSVVAYYTAIAHGVTPPHQPPELQRGLFDSLASLYDRHMVAGLKYKLPKIAGEKILARFPDKHLNLLDLGCGTGLLGVCLGRIDGFLIGVDISLKMIEQAARHNVYDRFHHANLLDALRDTPSDTYDVVAALDVFIYAGDLADTVPDAHRLLVAHGDFMFSCETAPEDGPDLVLQASGRYAHKRSHAKAVCQAAGFKTIEIEDLVLRYENNEPVQGFLVTARKGA
ncbi:tetratricopeptide repeat protein [Acidovorax sp. GBBC 3334]|uniref:tetratricopeptide repeat protein n=1 Tax=unclassified Acidovorax TaxID=2684926 RepID=UPI0023025925|nr:MULTISPECIES: tetratricopeptide repeat protein [unclassified Acidovorax]MDA8454821.1 tetratricopeptide repeat protein [Acidovorax sp. GBBC 3334]MDA8521846.1 tetratricopeptide repeat protein [Acidovorax sp. NCPPB 4044]